MSAKVVIYTLIFGLCSIASSLTEGRVPSTRETKSRQQFAPLALKDLFADELDVDGPTFPSKTQKRDVSHVLNSASKPSSTGSGAGSFASAGSFSSAGSGSSGSRGGFSGSGTGAGTGYSSLGTSYTPNTGFQDYYSTPFPYYSAQNIGPSFDQGFNFQTFLDQYFRNLQAQQEAIQAQLQAQQQAGGYSWAGSGAYAINSDGTIDRNSRIYSYSKSTGPNVVKSSSNFGNSYPVSGTPSSSSAYHNNRFFEINNRLGYGLPHQQFPSRSYGIVPEYAGTFTIPKTGYRVSISGTEPQTAVASVSLGPQGGHRAAEISPAAPGISSRFGDSVPPPSGNTFGVFTSSSSSHAVGPDGKETSFKSATTGVNDNGKVSYHTVHDP